MSAENSQRISRRELLVKVAQNSPFLLFSGLAAGNAINALRAGWKANEIDGEIAKLRLTPPSDSVNSPNKSYDVFISATSESLEHTDFSNDLKKIHNLEDKKEKTTEDYKEAGTNMVSDGAVSVGIAEVRTILDI